MLLLNFAASYVTKNGARNDKLFVIVIKKMELTVLDEIDLHGKVKEEEKKKKKKDHPSNPSITYCVVNHESRSLSVLYAG